MDNKIVYVDLEYISLIYTFRDNRVSFSVVPLDRKKDIVESKLYKNSTTQYFYIDNMIQLASRNDVPKRNFSHGQTLFNSTSGDELCFVEQKIVDKKDGKDVFTIFRSAQFEVTHVVSTKFNYQAFSIHNEVKNLGDDIYLDRFDSVVINSLTPLTESNDPHQMAVHTLDSYWSMEARKHTDLLARYDFKDSWSKLGVKVYRISSLGMMPARGHHPFMAIEDYKSNVTWAIQLKNPDSWQIEAIHNYGSVTLTGGHSDYLNGHWEKLLKHGEVYKTSEAIVSVTNGDVDQACMHITRYHDFLYEAPIKEKELPIIYNEYLYSWGRPNEEDIKKQFEAAKKLSCEEFVVDAGWFLSNELVGEGLLGDWNVNKDRFPNGLKSLKVFRDEYNFHTAGIWYEFEAVTTNSEIYKNHKEYLATLNGKIIQLDNRCFLDFNKKEVIDYLRDKVIKHIVDNDINYIKLDYNENIGFEIDGPSDNKAENVRLYSLNLLSFIKEIQDVKPDLVFESCSSGGMRHEPSFDYAGSMTSFSDAHEILGGVAIAMDMHRIMQPRIMQIWASLLPSHDLDQGYVVLAKGMLGRLCYSGKIDFINDDYLNLAIKASDYYKKIVPIIRDGNTTLIDTDEIVDLDNPQGRCRLIRESVDKDSFVYYVFNFDDNKETDLLFDGYELIDSFTNGSIINNHLTFNNRKLGAFVGLYRRKND